MKRLLSFIVTWFGSGLAPKAKGTCGTLAALPFAYLIHMQLGMLALLVATVLIFLLGWMASHHYMKYKNRSKDPQEIVIDEVAGMWLTLSAMPLLWLPAGQDYIAELYAAAFVAFRFFDIVKPWPVSWADKRVKGALGVMLDDILAALMAVLSLGLLGHLGMALWT